MDAGKKRFLAAQSLIFKALGHPSRLLMAEALTRGPCACAICTSWWAGICPRFRGILPSSGRRAW